MHQDQLNELIYQSLEHEMGGVKVYETAMRCAVNPDLKEEWGKYLEQTRMHVQRLQDVCAAFGLDPARGTPGREVVRGMGAALVDAMEMALGTGRPEAAQLVACEAVTIAETKDHLDWELLAKCAKQLPGAEGEALREACEQVEDEEDEHLYHTKGWCRELWVQSLGMRAVLPPPEEEHHVKTAIGAARAEQASERTRRRILSEGSRMATRKSTSRSAAGKAGPRKSAAKTTARKASAAKSSKPRKSAAKKRAATSQKTASRKRVAGKSATAAKKSTSRKSASKTIAQRKVKKVMHERKAGTLRSGSGKKVTSRKQAIAIGLSEARKAGARVPRRKS